MTKSERKIMGLKWKLKKLKSKRIIIIKEVRRLKYEKRKENYG